MVYMNRFNQSDEMDEWTWTNGRFPEILLE